MENSILRSTLLAVVMLLTSVSADARYEITVIPERPEPGNSFQIEVSGMTSHGPASVSEPIIEILGTKIILQVSVDMGTVATPDTYTHVFDVPPLETGQYWIEFWEKPLYTPYQIPALVEFSHLQIKVDPYATKLYVLPVVVDSVHGLAGSLWETQVRIVKVNRFDEIVIRRVWVCLEDGGFADDPATAPTWELPYGGNRGRSTLLPAADLLEGTGADRGAVALEVEGGELLVDVSIIDVSLGGFMPPERYRPYGIGQTYSAVNAPQDEASHFSWLGGCYGERSLTDYCDNHYRNNIGLVNPNPEPMNIRVTVFPFVSSLSLVGDPEEGKVYTLPAFGWRQFAWPLNEIMPIRETIFFLLTYPLYGVANVEPEDDLPYHAYVSVVYTTPRGLISPRVNDPYFQLAQPGTIGGHLPP